MKKQETNSTSKTIEVEYTEADVNEMRKKGVSEIDLPKVGKHTIRPSRFITKRNEQKIKVTILLDADVLDFYREQAAKIGNLPYQTQINQELRQSMERAKHPKDKVVTVEMLENPMFLADLANKLKKIV